MESGTEPKLEITMESISKKIDEQFRFTRSVIFMCTCLILGVMFYIIFTLFDQLPELVVLRFMGKMEPIIQEARNADANISHQESHKTGK